MSSLHRVAVCKHAAMPEQLEALHSSNAAACTPAGCPQQHAMVALLPACLQMKRFEIEYHGKEIHISSEEAKRGGVSQEMTHK